MKKRLNRILLAVTLAGTLGTPQLASANCFARLVGAVIFAGGGYFYGRHQETINKDLGPHLQNLRKYVETKVKSLGDNKNKK